MQTNYNFDNVENSVIFNMFIPDYYDINEELIEAIIRELANNYEKDKQLIYTPYLANFGHLQNVIELYIEGIIEDNGNRPEIHESTFQIVVDKVYSYCYELHLYLQRKNLIKLYNLLNRGYEIQEIVKINTNLKIVLYPTYPTDTVYNHKALMENL